MCSKPGIVYSRYTEEDRLRFDEKYADNVREDGRGIDQEKKIAEKKEKKKEYRGRF